MFDDGIPKQLTERTGRHLCASCLAEVADEEYFRNDLVCDACAERLEPLVKNRQPDEKAGKREP